MNRRLYHEFEVIKIRHIEARCQFDNSDFLDCVREALIMALATECPVRFEHNNRFYTTRSDIRNWVVEEDKPESEK